MTIWLKNQSKVRYRTFQLSEGPELLAGLELPREAEVDEFDDRVLGVLDLLREDEVLGLDVPVHEALRVQVGDGLEPMF